jgi:hypothetical protein
MNFTFKNDRIYDALKWICQIVIPAIATLYFTLSGIWGSSYFPCGEQVVGTLTAIDTFLGVCLGISTYQYKKGVTANVNS